MHNGFSTNGFVKRGNACDVVVVKIGGAAMEAPAPDAPSAAAAIAALNQWRPGEIVIVHGGGAEIDRHLARLGMTSEKRDGIRITPPEHIEEVVAVLAGKINARLVGQLLGQNVPAVGLSLGDGFLMRAEKATHYPYDPGHVGQTVGGNPALVRTLLSSGFVPVLSSIGFDASGSPLNINADDAAADLVRVLGASNLMLLTDVAGVLDGNGEILPQLSADEIEERIARGEITGGMVPKVRSAVALAHHAHISVIIASWRDAMKVRDLNHDEWIGTRIVPSREAVLVGLDGDSVKLDAMMKADQWRPAPKSVASPAGSIS